MGDGDTGGVPARPSPLAQLGPDEFRETYRMVTLFALRLTGSKTQAEDLTHEAFLRSMTTRDWNPEREPSPARHLMAVVRSLRSHEWSSRRRGYEAAAATEHEATVGDLVSSPEELALDRFDQDQRRDRAARLLARLRERLAGRTLELSLLDQTASGVDDAAGQARETGRPIDEVYEARRRIQRYIQRIIAEETGKDEEVA